MAAESLCPSWGDIIFENGNATYESFDMAVAEESGPGISGIATKPLGLTGRPITVKGVLTGEDGVGIVEKQAAMEAACETFVLDTFKNGGGRSFENTRFIKVVWVREYANAASGFNDAEYVATLKQLFKTAPEVTTGGS